MKQIHVAEEAVVAALMRHVSGRIHMDQEPYAGDHRSITAVSGSIKTPQGTWKSNDASGVRVHHAGRHPVETGCSSQRAPSAGPRDQLPDGAKAKHIERRKTLPTHTTFTPMFGKRRPINNISAAPASGNSGIIQMCARKYSVGNHFLGTPVRAAYHLSKSISSPRQCLTVPGKTQ